MGVGEDGPQPSVPPCPTAAMVCMVCDQQATRTCTRCSAGGGEMTGHLCQSEACFTAVHAFQKMADAHRPALRAVSEETRLEVCSVHGKRVYLVCRDAGCRSALMCARCVTSQAHKGHEYDDIGEAFDATKAKLHLVLSQLETAEGREVRAAEALASVTASFNKEQVAVQLHYSTACIEDMQDVGRVGVVAAESLWRAMLQAHEAHDRVVNRCERTGLQQVERLGRDEIMASRELSYETSRRLFLGELERIALLRCIDQLSQRVPLVEAALALPVTMPCTLQKRAAELSGTDESVPAECSVGAIDQKVWRKCATTDDMSVQVKAPAVYPADGSPASHIALSPCMRLCCVCTHSGNLYVYDTSSSEQVAHLHDDGVQQDYGDPFEHNSPVWLYIVGFSRCGTWLAAGRPGVISVFRTATWECVCTWLPVEQSTQGDIDALLMPEAMLATGWAHGSVLVASATPGELRLWDVSVGAIVHLTSSTLRQQPHYQQGSSVYCGIPVLAITQTRIFTPNYLAISEFDAAALKETRIMCQHKNIVTDLILTTDETKLVSYSQEDMTVHVWCTASGAELLGRNMLHLGIGELAVMSQWRLQPLNPNTACEGTVQQARPGCHDAALSPCGRWMFRPGPQGGVEVVAQVVQPQPQMQMQRQPAAYQQPAPPQQLHQQPQVFPVQQQQQRHLYRQQDHQQQAHLWQQQQGQQQVHPSQQQEHIHLWKQEEQQQQVPPEPQPHPSQQQEQQELIHLWKQEDQQQQVHPSQQQEQQDLMHLWQKQEGQQQQVPPQPQPSPPGGPSPFPLGWPGPDQ